MSKQVKFQIIGQPVAKGRPRVSMRGQYPHAYTPKKTAQWEEFVRFQSLQYKPPGLPPTCPIEMSLTFWMPRPKSLPKRVWYHVKRPDVDNLIKSVMDALEGIFYANDSQIYKLNVEKKYADNITSLVGVDVEIRYNER